MTMHLTLQMSTSLSWCNRVYYNVFKFPERHLHQRKGCVSVSLPFVQLRTQMPDTEYRGREKENILPALNLTFMRERSEKLPCSRRPRSHAIAILDTECRRKRPTTTTLGLSISFYLLLCPTFLPIRAWLSVSLHGDVASLRAIRPQCSPQHWKLAPYFLRVRNFGISI